MTPLTQEVLLNLILYLSVALLGVSVVGQLKRYFWDAPAPSATVRSKKQKKAVQRLLDNPAAAAGVSDVTAEEDNEADEEEEDDNETNTKQEEEEEEEAASQILSFGETLNRYIPPIPWRTKRFLQRVASISVAVLFAYILGSGVWSGRFVPAHVEGDIPGLSPQQVTAQGMHYYYPTGFINASDVRIPVIACHHFPALETLHEQVLGPRYVQHALLAKPQKAAGLFEKSPDSLVDHKREQARHMCILEKEAVAQVDFHMQNHDAHLFRPAFWKLRPPPVTKSWYPDAPISHVFVTTHGTRYYRVMQVANIPPYKQFSLVPLLVAEQDLVRMAAHWYEHMRVTAGKQLVPDDPCLCAEHLGLLGSELFLLYEETRDEWSVMLHASVVKNLTQPDSLNPLEYNSHLEFPYRVDMLYAVRDLVHYGRVVIETLDPRSLFESPAGRAEVVHELNEHHMDETSSILAAVNLNPLMANPHSVALKERELTGKQNWCFHHCRAMADKVAEMVAHF